MIGALLLGLFCGIVARTVNMYHGPGGIRELRWHMAGLSV